MSTDRVTLSLESLGMDYDADGWMHNAYKATLHYQGRRLTTPFRTGEGWTEDPTAADVLECLLSDAAGYDNAQDAEDWAREYGYLTPDNDDSRAAWKKAEQQYRETGKQTEKLRRLLGEDYDAAVFPTADDDSEQVAARLTGEESPRV